LVPKGFSIEFIRIDQVLSSLKEEKSISADTLAGIQRAVSQLETLGDTFPAEEVVAVKGTAINLCDAIRYSCELMVAYLQKLGSVPSVHQLLSNCNSLKATTM
jgi:site-specific recombinase XerC